MTANDLTFGIEIECTFPVGNAPAMGHYHDGVQVQGLPIGWNSQRDGSIHSGRGFVGVEIVSPVLKGADGVAQVKTVCEWLKAKWRSGQPIDRPACPRRFRQDRRGPSPKTGTVSWPTWKKRSTLRPARKAGNVAGTVLRSREASTIRTANWPHVCRYHVLNVQTGKPTVEFRAFAGTINFTKILAHVMTCLGVVEKTLKVKRMPEVGRQDAGRILPHQPRRRRANGLESHVLLARLDEGTRAIHLRGDRGRSA